LQPASGEGRSGHVARLRRRSIEAVSYATLGMIPRLRTGKKLFGRDETAIKDKPIKNPRYQVRRLQSPAIHFADTKKKQTQK
jgi:hypothetical protein